MNRLLPIQCTPVTLASCGTPLSAWIEKLMSWLFDEASNTLMSSPTRTATFLPSGLHVICAVAPDTLASLGMQYPRAQRSLSSTVTLRPGSGVGFLYSSEPLPRSTCQQPTV